MALPEFTNDFNNIRLTTTYQQQLQEKDTVALEKITDKLIHQKMEAAIRPSLSVCEQCLETTDAGHGSKHSSGHQRDTSSQTPPRRKRTESCMWQWRTSTQEGTSVWLKSSQKVRNFSLTISENSWLSRWQSKNCRPPVSKESLWSSSLTPNMLIENPDQGACKHLQSESQAGAQHHTDRQNPGSHEELLSSSGNQTHQSPQSRRLRE